MRVSASLWLLLCVLLVFDDVVDGAKKKKNKKGGGKKDRKKGVKCQAKVTAEEFHNNGFTVQCGKNQIASVAVVGHNGSNCQGLTPNLFVQMNTCFWKSNCTLSYDKMARNYMIKLYKGNMRDCITRQPSDFTISYECTTGKGKVYDVREATNSTKAVKENQGILRSHAHHPWLYKRHHFVSLRESLTLTPKKKKNKAFAFTVRSLSLMHGDKLTVNSTDDKGQPTVRHFTSAVSVADDVKSRTHDFPSSAQVTVTLETGLYTNGGEGFVICYQWKKKMGKKKKDACKKLIKAGGCQKKVKKG